MTKILKDKTASNFLPLHWLSHIYTQTCQINVICSVVWAYIKWHNNEKFYSKLKFLVQNIWLMEYVCREIKFWCSGQNTMNSFQDIVFVKLTLKSVYLNLLHVFYKFMKTGFPLVLLAVAYVGLGKINMSIRQAAPSFIITKIVIKI